MKVAEGKGRTFFRFEDEDFDGLQKIGWKILFVDTAILAMTHSASWSFYADILGSKHGLKPTNPLKLFNIFDDFRKLVAKKSEGIFWRVIKKFHAVQLVILLQIQIQ